MKLNQNQLLALLVVELLTLFSCRAGTGESATGHGSNPFPFNQNSSVHSTTGLLDSSFALLKTLNNTTGIRMLDSEVESAEETPAEASLTTANTEYCLEDTTTPKALTGETAAGSGFSSGELSVESGKYAARNLYCMIENDDASFSIQSPFKNLKQIICVLNKKDDAENPLKNSELYGQDLELGFVFSSECFAESDLQKAQDTIGSLQGRFTFKKEIEKDGWSEQLTFSAMNWENANTVWTVKVNFGEQHDSLALLNSIGERDGASEYVLLQSDLNGKIFIERQIMLLQTADFSGNISLFNGASPYNYRMRFLLDSKLESEQLKVGSIHSLDASWSTLTAYEESDENKGKGFVYRLSGNENLDFATNAYVCYNSGDKTCNEFAVLGSYTNINACAPSASGCQESAPTFTPEEFSGFSMVADPETVGYKTPEGEFSEVDPLEFKSTVN